MGQKTLVTEQIDAGERLIREFNKTIPVSAAFWLTERESDEWYFYLASDQIDDANVDLAYGEVLRLVPPDQSLWIDPFQVKVVATDAPVAKAALDVMRKYPAQLPTRYHGRRFGGLSVEEVFIYPLPMPVSA